MIRFLALASMMLVTALAVNVQAAECEGDESCAEADCFQDGEGQEVCRSDANGPDGEGAMACDDEVCAYGNETCIECSGPVDDGMAGPTRGPDDGSCENCRDLTGGDDAKADVDEDAPGFGVLAALGAAAAVAMLVRRK